MVGSNPFFVFHLSITDVRPVAHGREPGALFFFPLNLEVLYIFPIRISELS